MKKLIILRYTAATVFYLLFFLCGTVCCFNPAKAQPQLVFSPLIQKLNKPLLVTNAGDSSGRLFIAEQGGLIKIYKNGGVLSKPFLDLRSLIRSRLLTGLRKLSGYVRITEQQKTGLNID